MKSVLIVVCLIVGMVTAETIHFTNSVKHLKTTKNFTTYEVEVPGSRPITIIEANPEEANRQATQQKPQFPIIRYRNAGGASVDDHAHVVVDDGTKGSKGNSAKKTLYSPDLLNKFLKEYSEKLKNADQVTRQKLNEISMINTGGNKGKVEATNVNQSKEDQVQHFSDVHERHGGNSKWSGDNGKTTHPWNIKDGWVTMEAVPWSESKVSKWQSNSNKYGNRNQNQNQYHSSNQWTSNESEEIMSRPKPMQTSNNYYANDDYVDYGDSSYQVPNRPTSYTSEKPSRPTFESLYNRRYKPSEDYFNRKSSSHNPDYSGGDTWYDHGFKKPSQQTADIITDGRKPYFPQYSSTSTRPQQPTTDRNHPQSYPENGNGEWVLISTTKGYQYPRRKGQRAITFAPQATSLTHKSVKLTVLPMKNSLDMTTSHNGLIEVSSSTQTVEQAYNQHQQQQQQHQNKIDLPAQPSPAPASSSLTPTRKKRVTAPKFTVMRQDSGLQDSSTVLAAVGAGLVPATLAVLAPMVLGRKRRSPLEKPPHPEQLLAPTL